jgi:YD repeat-containing protein
VAWVYNQRNLATTITYPGSLNVTRGYDNAGRWTSVRDWNSNTTSFGYDADSNLTTETFPAASAIVDTFTFNAADQVTNVASVKGGSTTLFSAGYNRDSANQLTSDTSAASGTGSYKYTPLNQVCYAGSSNTNACSSPPSGSIAYAYDAADNLTQKGTTQQAFNNADELCWTASTSAACGSPPTGATTYQYDTRGNWTNVTPSGGQAQTLTFDQANRLTKYAVGFRDLLHHWQPRQNRLTLVRLLREPGLCPGQRRRRDPGPLAGGDHHRQGGRDTAYVSLGGDLLRRPLRRRRPRRALRQMGRHDPHQPGQRPRQPKRFRLRTRFLLARGRRECHIWYSDRKYWMGAVVTEETRPGLPPLIRIWSWGNGACLLAFVVVGFVTPIYLPLVFIVLVAGALQIAVGVQLATNFRGTAEQWAAWGRNRSVLIGFGSRSRTVNRVQGIASVALGMALIAAAAWLALALRPLI